MICATIILLVLMRMETSRNVILLHFFSVNIFKAYSVGTSFYVVHRLQLEKRGSEVSGVCMSSIIFDK